MTQVGFKVEWARVNIDQTTPSLANDQVDGCYIDDAMHLPTRVAERINGTICNETRFEHRTAEHANATRSSSNCIPR